MVKYSYPKNIKPKEIFVMNIISKKHKDEKKIETTIKRFFMEFNIGSLLKKCNFVKTNGPTCRVILEFLFKLLFTGKSLYRLLESEERPDFCKNVAYRFLNSIRYNWRRFLFLLSSKVIKKKLNF